MKKIVLLIILFSFSFISKAQTINVNPDKSGEPWLVSGLRPLSQEELDKIPELVVPNSYKTKRATLPSSLDNSTSPYFRPVFNQSHGSCGQASGVGYTFTYEMNYLRDTPANVTANQYPTHYTYNFLNEGSGSNGSWYMDGWEIIKANGCPNVPTYGSFAGTATKWMSGYSKYESAMANRVKDYFMIDVGTPSGLEDLKYWMYDHLDGSATGGIVNFAAGATGYHMVGNKIVEWGHTVDHAMTIVGWNDTIAYDYNGDGSITNNIDLNGDGVIDMKDWERGALIMVNSWGTSFGNGGKAFMMYKTLADTPSNGGIANSAVFGIHVKESPEPQLTLKVKMTHSSRKNIKIFAGISSDLTDTHPDDVIFFPFFAYQGGDFPMRGNSSSPIEFSIDITELLSFVTPGEVSKVFLGIHESDPSNESTGIITDFSIVDAEGNTFTHTPSNEPINNNTYTFLSITATLDFDFPNITTSTLPVAVIGTPYSKHLNATGGSAPYSWEIIQEYIEEANSETFPEISSNKLTPTDNDDGLATKSLDFSFPFYGTNYNEIYLSTDGSIVFDPTFNFIRSANSIKGNKVLSVFASDLLINNSSQGIYYEGDADSATFRWKETLYNDTTANIDVAVTLYPDGHIDYFYGNAITPDITWAAGISDGNGSFKLLNISGISDPSNAKTMINTTPFPIGMSIDNTGNFSGTLTEEGSWDVVFKVTDATDVSSYKTLNLITSAASITSYNVADLKVFPNPVNGVLKFDYTLMEESNINISIYDFSGRLIKTLENKNLESGNHINYWDTSNFSGVYFYKITNNKQVKSGKIIVR